MATFRYLVHDVDAVLPFYAALGFDRVERWGPPFAIVSRGSDHLWLSGPGSSAAQALPDSSQPAPGGWNRIVLEVPDLESAMEPLRRIGARFRSGPVAGPGGRQVVVEDPSGNPIELFELRWGEEG